MALPYKPRKINMLLNSKADIEHKLQVLSRLVLVSSEEEARRKDQIERYQKLLAECSSDILKELEQ